MTSTFFQRLLIIILLAGTIPTLWAQEYKYDLKSKHPCCYRSVKGIDIPLHRDRGSKITFLFYKAAYTISLISDHRAYRMSGGICIVEEDQKKQGRKFKLRRSQLWKRES